MGDKGVTCIVNVPVVQTGPLDSVYEANYQAGGDDKCRGELQKAREYIEISKSKVWINRDKWQLANFSVLSGTGDFNESERDKTVVYYYDAGVHSAYITFVDSDNDNKPDTMKVYFVGGDTNHKHADWVVIYSARLFNGDQGTFNALYQKGKQ